MSDTYTKLFRSITASTIVSEPVATRWLWVTMLSQADKAGKVYASVPGLARIANISMAEVEAGIECFLSPDPYSRTTENEGRRIESCDGGWRLLNHAKYDAMRSEAERREVKREWDRKNRPSGHQRAAKAEADETRQSDSSPPQSDETRQSGPISHSSFPITQKEQKQERARNAPTPAAMFPDVDPEHLRDWVAARKAKRLPLTETAAKGFRNAAAKAGMTAAEAVKFCAEKGWAGLHADGLPQSRAGPPAGAQPMGKQMQGLMALEDRKRELQQRLAGNRDSDGPAKTVLLVAGSNACG
jgi:hypothetical protein